MMFKCPDCIYMSTNEDRMAAHVKFVHQTLPRIFVCTACNQFETSWNRAYYDHMVDKHFTGPPFACDLCHESYGTIQNLLTHRMRHSE